MSVCVEPAIRVFIAARGIQTRGKSVFASQVAETWAAACPPPPIPVGQGILGASRAGCIYLVGGRRALPNSAHAPTCAHPPVAGNFRHEKDGANSVP